MGEQKKCPWKTKSDFCIASRCACRRFRPSEKMLPAMAGSSSEMNYFNEDGDYVHKAHFDHGTHTETFEVVYRNQSRGCAPD